MEWTMGYGAQGRLASVTDPHGFTEAYTYETTGEVKTIKDRLERTTTMSHDQLGRLLSLVDTLGRKHQRSFTVPVSGAWSGPSLQAASADASAATSSLSAALRAGDYQLGVNAHDIEGFPAQISFYRDATFALGYTSYFDNAGRPQLRADRTSHAFESSVVPAGSDAGGFAQEQFSYDATSSAPLLALISAPRAGSSEPSAITRDVEHDVLTAGGSGPGIEFHAKYTFTRDAGGRVTQMTTRLISSLGLATPPVTTLTYRPDGRLAQKTNADGVHDFTYDARGQLATQTIAGEGVYTYAYDELGRSTKLTFPDGHERRQVFDDLGRITSRCYAYPGNPSQDRCYGAQYDAVGNPVRLLSPEGDDVMEIDALDRLTKVTREVGGAPVAIETYGFNALGALKVNAGAALDDQRPRLVGGGTAGAAVAATLGGQPVTLDGGGRVTSLRGVSFTWSFRGYPLSAAPPVPALPETYTVDASLRRVSKVQGASVEYYVYDGADRIGVVDAAGQVVESYLFDGVDHPLRMKRGGATVYFELDLAGNVRRLRGDAGVDHGGYRYTAFGKMVADDAVVVQPLRWKARWWQSLGGGELYDVRARQWSPELGSFLSIDEYAFHDASATLWGWPGQNPAFFSDPMGRLGEHNSSGTLPWWLRGIDGFNNFDMGVRTRAQGISLMSNDATAALGEQMAGCGSAQMTMGMAQAVDTGAMAVAGVDIAVGLGKLAATAPRANIGRSGGQERLRQIAKDPNTSRADRGWIKQELNAIERGQRSSIRNPPGKDLAHSRGREAAKGYDHVESPSNLQDRDLHRTQHKFDDWGRANTERP